MRQEFQGHEIRVMGRTVMDGGMLWLASSLSEAGFRVTGAGYLRLVIRADDTVTDPDRKHITPRYAVRLNGKEVCNARMEQETETVDVFQTEIPEDAEVRLIKLSECTQSLMALASIETDGQIAPLPELTEKIEFIGDSITCGYGVEAANGEEQFTTATENAWKSYAGLISETTGRDRMLTCFSGHGIVSGYTADPETPNRSELVPPYYEMTGRNGYRLPSGRTVTDIAWDFARWQPEQIVINLGTNDLSWCMDHEDRKAYYRREYAEFLKTVRKNNPHAWILCVLGIMGEGLNEYMPDAVADYMQETGDQNIRAVTLKEQDGTRNGYGANYHPSEATQRELAECVRSLLDTCQGSVAED